jgi:hypothetical protein
VPSILDGAEYPIPEIVETFKENAEKERNYLPWWDKLGLVDEPFHELEGLDKIDRQMWETIVHKTEVFKRYEQVIEKTPMELFRNTVWYGTFGSGKTTFFDYLQPKLYASKIYPIYLQLGGEYETRELVFEFKRRLRSELQQLGRIIIGYGLQNTDQMDDQEAIIELLKSLIEHHAKGFIVFIDDLHKGDLDKAMKFMSHLQVITSQISRASPSSLNFGFYVAGIPDWEGKMAFDDKFLSSVSHEEHMPPLKPDMAVDVINRRLKAFARNPDNPRKLPPEYIEKIYKRIQYSGREVTFRRLLHEVRKELALEHFYAFNIDPVNIPVSTLEEIRTSLEDNLLLRGKMYKLIYGAKNLKPAQKRHCLEILVEMYTRNGLKENDIREADVAFLQQLSRAGLIVKVVKEGRLTWKVSQDLVFFNTKIIDRYNLSFEDYLLKIYYADLPEAKRKIKLLGPEIEYLDTLIGSMKQSLTRDLLVQTRALHVDIVETGDKYLNAEDEKTAIINKCVESLARLTKAYQSYENVPISVEAKNIEILYFWKDFWKSPEVIQQFIRACSSYTEDIKKTAPHVVSLYREAFPQLFSFFKEEYEKSRQFHVPIVNLKNTEIELLHKCRDFWIESKYQELVEKLASYVERDLRTFLFNIFNVFYGDYEHRCKWIDPESRKYIQKNLGSEQSKGWHSIKNEFVQLNRAQYKNLMTGEHGSAIGRRNWQNIFSKVYRQWTEKDLDSFLDMFAEINIKVSHLKDTMESSDQDYVYTFMQRSLHFLMDINQAYTRLLTPSCFKYCSPEETYLGLNGFEGQALTPISLTKDDVLQIQEALVGKEKVKIPLDDQEYIGGMIGLSYRKAYALIALLLAQSEEMMKKTKMRLEIMSSKGCETYVCLKQL